MLNFCLTVYICCTFWNHNSLILLIKFTGVALKKGPCILVFFSMNFSSHVGCPPSEGKQWWSNMAVTRVPYSFLLIELGSVWAFMAVSMWVKSSLLKSYKGGLWKTFTGLGPKNYNIVALSWWARSPDHILGVASGATMMLELLRCY